SDQYSYNNVSRVLNINISNVPHSIFKSIEGILVNCNIQTGNVPNVFNILYSHMFPVIDDQITIKSFFYADNVDITFNISNISIDFSELFSKQYISNLNILSVILLN
ncbi:MAG: hypothetical protein QXF12_00975, partial [Candidatus Aenigmatarchaeota archaeon]